MIGMLLVALILSSAGPRTAKSELASTQFSAAFHLLLQSASLEQVGIVRLNSSIFACVSADILQAERTSVESTSRAICFSFCVFIVSIEECGLKKRFNIICAGCLLVLGRFLR